MSIEYLSKSGATWLISKIKTALSGKVDKVDGKGLSTNDYTTAEKSKLSGIAAGAEVNQNAFSNVTVGSTTVAADSTTDTLTLVAGSNVSITPDATNDKITISATVPTKVSQLTNDSGYKTTDNNTTYSISKSGSTITLTGSDGSTSTVSDANTTYDVATTSAAGLMSVDDKKKLNSIAAGAEVNQNAFSSVVVGSTTVAADTKTDSLTLVAGANVMLTPDADNDTITIAAKDTTYTVATASANGLMSKSDKSKLDGVAAGAQVNVIESVKVNGSALTPSSKAVNITVPTKISALTNDSGFQTAAQVTSAINSAVSGITSFEFRVVTALPSTGKKGVIYLVAHTHTGSGDVYDEYIWVTDKFEKIGNTDIDLSDYAKTADFVAISETELSAMWTA